MLLDYEITWLGSEWHPTTLLQRLSNLETNQGKGVAGEKEERDWEAHHLSNQWSLEVGHQREPDAACAESTLACRHIPHLALLEADFNPPFLHFVEIPTCYFILPFLLFTCPLHCLSLFHLLSSIDAPWSSAMKGSLRKRDTGCGIRG